MKIVYMGTPDFAVPPLERILIEGHEVALVVTQPDKPRDRGKKVQPTPVKALAMEKNLPFVQPEVLKGNAELLRQISVIKPDVIVVVAYGKLLPGELLSIPQYGCVNIHGSLLPQYRGAAPIQRAILSGDEKTGVTLMYLSLEMDEGDIIAARSTQIGKKTAGDLHEELSQMGADLLAVTLPAIEAGAAPRIKQDGSLASYAPPLSKKDGLVDFSRSPVEIERQIRAMSPWPGAYTYYKGEPMKLLAAYDPKEGDRSPDFKSKGRSTLEQPGMILSVDSKGMKVRAGNGNLMVSRIKMPGKREVDISEYIKGNKIEISTVLG
jgi:methionyl-tRNA formyltransferase